MADVNKLVDAALSKGADVSNALYSLRRELGEDAVNDALLARLRRRDARVVQGWNPPAVYEAKELTGRDAATFVELLAEVWGPEGKANRAMPHYEAWSRDKPPGFANGVELAVHAAVTHDDRRDEFLERLPHLPSPWREAAALVAQRHGAKPGVALPASYLEAFVRCWLGADNSDQYAPDDYRLGDAQVRPVIERLLEGDASFWMHPRRLGQLASWLDARLFRRALERTSYYRHADYSLGFDAVVTFAKREAAALVALTEALLAQPEVRVANNYEQPAWPALYAYFGQLRANEQGVCPLPDARTDAAAARMLDGFRLHWYTLDGTPALRSFGALLLRLPRERWGAVFAAQREPNPGLLALCPEPEAQRRAAARLLELPVRPHETTPLDVSGAAALLSATPEGCRALVEALAKPGGPRGVLAKALAARTEPAAAEVLVLLLGDGAKGVRDEARSALLKNAWQPRAEVLSLLRSALRSKAKDARLEAARVLLEWPEAQGAADLAREFVAGEKVAAVSALLKQAADRAPASASSVAATAPESVEAPASAKARSKKTSKKSEAAPEPAAPAVEAAPAPARDPAVLAAAEALRALLATEGYAMGSYSFDRWVEALPAEHRAATLDLVASDDSYARLEERGRKPHVELELLLGWLALHAPAAGLDAFSKNIEHKRVRPVEASVRGLHRAGAAGAARAAALLARASKKGALELLRVLRWGGTRAELAAVEALLLGKHDAALRGPLEAARAACAAEGFDATTFDDSAAGDARLDAALAGLPSSGASAPRTALRTRHGHALSDGARAWFVGQLLLEGYERRGAAVRSVRARLRDEDCAALCDELLAAAPKSDVEDGPWLFLRAVVAGPAQVDALVTRLEVLATMPKGDYGGHGVHVLTRLGTAQCVRALDKLRRSSRRASLRSRAEYGLFRLADERGCTVDALLDAALERFGFDEHGVRAVPWQGATLTVRLLDDNAVRFEDASGVALEKLPVGRKLASADAVTRATLAQLAKDVARSDKLQRALWERAMALETAWRGDAFRDRFGAHPLARGPGRRLVYLCERSDGTAAVTAPFVFDERRATIDLDGRAFALRDDDRVRIAHPLHLRPEERERARTRVLPEGARPPFTQLDRRCFEARGLERKADGALRLPTPSDRPGYMVTRLHRLGYEPGDRQDAGLVHNSSKRLGPYVFNLGHTPYLPSDTEILDDRPFEVDYVQVVHNGKEVAVDALPPVLLSELLRELWLLAGHSDGEGPGPSDDDGEADEGNGA